MDQRFNHPGLLAWTQIRNAEEDGNSSDDEEDESSEGDADEASPAQAEESEPESDEVERASNPPSDSGEEDETPKDEMWDVYYNGFLLHTSKHSDMYWHRENWWFPDPGRNEETMPMFEASRLGVLEEMKYYDLLCPDGTIVESLCYRFVGEDEDEAWLQDYIAYNLNLVMIDMKVITD